MKPLVAARSVMRALAAIAMPGVACFGYYTLEDAGDIGVGMATLLVLAYPAALLGSMWLVIAVFSTRRSRFHL